MRRILCLMVVLLLGGITTATMEGDEPVARNADWTPVIENINGMEMVLVPPGCFLMGLSPEDAANVTISNDDQAVFGEYEMPQHEICFEKSFWIGRYEVTVGEFQEFIDAGGYDNPDYWTEAGWEWRQSTERSAPEDFFEPSSPRLARTGVTWYEAVAFANWKGGRLPTEAEWEYAAKGPDNLIYPWGNEFVQENIVSFEDGAYVIAEVDSKRDGSSWVGAMNMAGNACEWTSSHYRPYPYDATDGREDLDNPSRPRVMRGCMWVDLGNDLLRVDNRLRGLIKIASEFNGLRIVIPS
jgi:formylglycine-generating enzyme required for sulfatase activity